MATAFISYSHRDEIFRDELEKHLSPLQRQGLLDIWHDRRIIAGDPLDDTISQNLESADLILMLISSDFIASDYCYGREMTRAAERHAAGAARAISIVCRPCVFDGLPFSQFLLLPTDAKAVSRWQNEDSAWVDVVRGIRMALVQAPSRPQPSSFTATPEPARPFASSAFRFPPAFTDLEKHDYLHMAFEQMYAVFNANGAALEAENPGVTVRLTRVDTQAFAVRIFVHGREAGGGLIFHGSGTFGHDQICFSYNASGPRSSMNEWFSIDIHDGALVLKSGGMLAMMSDRRENPLTAHDAATVLWNAVLEQAKARLR